MTLTDALRVLKLRGNMTSHCLIVTHHPLSNLAAKQHGVYQRFAMLLRAADAAQSSLRIFCIAEPTEINGDDVSTSGKMIEKELHDFWKIGAVVRVVVADRQESSLPWFIQQLLAIAGFSRTPLQRSLFPKNVLKALGDEILENPAFVIAHRLPSMYALLALGANLPPVFFDLDDVEHVANFRKLRYESSVRDKLFGLLSLPATMIAEYRAIKASTKTFICSQADLRSIEKMFGRCPLAVIPNGIETPDRAVNVVESPILLMVGTYAYGPNRDGADFFVSEIFPKIREQLPAAELWLVGAGYQGLESFRQKPDGVSFLGFVDDLAAVYESARVVICPIRFGSGTRMKLIEAAAFGKPIVTTTVGAEGLDLNDTEHLLMADTASAFAESCTKLLVDDGECLRLSRNALKRAQERHGRDEIVDQIATHIRSMEDGAAQDTAPIASTPKS